MAHIEENDEGNFHHHLHTHGLDPHDDGLAALAVTTTTEPDGNDDHEGEGRIADSAAASAVEQSYRRRKPLRSTELRLPPGKDCEYDPVTRKRAWRLYWGADVPLGSQPPEGTVPQASLREVARVCGVKSPQTIARWMTDMRSDAARSEAKKRRGRKRKVNAETIADLARIVEDGAQTSGPDALFAYHATQPPPQQQQQQPHQQPAAGSAAAAQLRPQSVRNLLEEKGVCVSKATARRVLRDRIGCVYDQKSRSWTKS